VDGMGGAEMLMTVGRVAELTGVTVRTLHHYDEIGLVEPSSRTTGVYRAYSASDVDGCGRC
jgi:DNA-binding transcriptional MerR regulator